MVLERVLYRQCLRMGGKIDSIQKNIIAQQALIAPVVERFLDAYREKGSNTTTPLDAYASPSLRRRIRSGFSRAHPGWETVSNGKAVDALR